MEPEESYIYWEKQAVGRHCGVHCINSLLQGPFYKPEDLANIALDLDMKETHLLEGLEAPSGNVDADGNYSVQVLIQALNQVGEGLKIEPISALPSYAQVQAYLCHSDHHWFGVRIVRGTWYNLNSTLGKMPQLVTLNELLAFLQKNKKNSSCKIFAIIGNSLPLPKITDFQHYEGNQRWVKEAEIRKHHEEEIQKENGVNGLYVYGITEEEWMAMLKMSMDEGGGHGYYAEDEIFAMSMKYEQGFDDAAASAGACAAPQPQTAAAAPVHYPKLQLLSNTHDPDLFFITRQSLQSLFSPQPATGTLINFAFPQNSTVSRRFPLTFKIESLYDYVFLKVTESYPQNMYRFYLTSKGEVLRNMEQTIGELTKQQSITIAVHKN